MRLRNPSSLARWLFLPTALLPVVIAIPCALALVKQQFLQGSRFLFLDNADFWVSCAGGVICGSLWVITVMTVSPIHKLAAAGASLVPGAFLAWTMMGASTFHVAGLMSGFSFTTHAPALLACWAASATLAVAWIRTRRRAPQPGDVATRPRWIDLSFLAASVMALCLIVLPATTLFARWTVYHWALRAIKCGTDDDASRRIELLDSIPGVDLEWTPGNMTALIPFGSTLDMEIFGCPTCRGIHVSLLAHAARHGKESAVRLMVKRRGTVEYHNDRGLSLLSAAIVSRKTSVVDFVLSAGADVRATDLMAGFGTMHHAVARKGTPEVLELLLAAGVPINAVSRSGLTPLDLAHLYNTDVIPFLLEHGATNAAVRERLLPGSDGFHVFDGTKYGIRLPEGFAPWNRAPSKPGRRTWQVRNARSSSLSFSLLDQPIAPTGVSTTFMGLPAVASREVNDWGHCWCASGRIAFDSTRRSREELERSGKQPAYDAVIEYDAFRGRDLRLLEESLSTFFCNDGNRVNR